MAEFLDLKYGGLARAALQRAQERDDRALVIRPRGDPALARWHIVHVAAKFERGIADADSFVARQIKAAGFEVYSARMRKMVTPRSNSLSRAQRATRHAFAREKIEPLFPGYEFVRFDQQASNWHEIFRLVGVYGMLCEHNLPVPVPDRFIAGLRKREINGAIPAETPASELFALGETVRIVKDGLFKLLTGQVGRFDDAGRIRLLLDMFGGQVPVDLTFADVEKL
ncbi:MAG TPA: transcription termination/antitermination protein NusG [Xanthobacteraceae bacterium]